MNPFDPTSTSNLLPTFNLGESSSFEDLFSFVGPDITPDVPVPQAPPLPPFTRFQQKYALKHEVVPRSFHTKYNFDPNYIQSINSRLPPSFSPNIAPFGTGYEPLNYLYGQRPSSSRYYNYAQEIPQMPVTAFDRDVYSYMQYMDSIGQPVSYEDAARILSGSESFRAQQPVYPKY